MSTFIRSTERLAGVFVAATLLVGFAAGPASGAARSVHAYQAPDVVLVDSAGQELALAPFLDSERPVLLQFVFTTCPAVCPVLTATMRSVHDRLLEASIEADIVSISIDPEHDTPQRLRAHAETFGAEETWRFLTGGVDEIERVQKAFDAYRDDKMSHAPLTFLRPGPGAYWVRFEGFVGAEEIVGELLPAESLGESPREAPRDSLGEPAAPSSASP